MKLKHGIVAAACLLVSLAGCGGGGSGDNSNSTPSFGNQFPTRFTVFQDPSTGTTTYRTTDNGLITAQGATQLLQTDVVNYGGASYTVFDMNSQQYNPAGNNGTGRYLVTVRNTGTTATPVLQYSFQDNKNPGTSLPSYTVQQNMAGPTLYDNSYQAIQGYITPNSSASGAGFVMASLSNAFFQGQKVIL